MKPIKFKEQNTEIAKNQPQYITLPAHKVKNDEGEVIFCIGLNFWERLRLLWTGKLWCCILTFNPRA